MNRNKKLLIVGISALMLLGIGLVSASSYYSMNEIHKRMMASDDFEQMHTAMMSGDFEAAEKYHDNLNFECPMHELVKEGDVSLEEFQTMHQWMISGDFPKEKPASLSDAASEIHKQHHPSE